MSRNDCEAICVVPLIWAMSGMLRAFCGGASLLCRGSLQWSTTSGGTRLDRIDTFNEILTDGRWLTADALNHLQAGSSSDAASEWKASRQIFAELAGGLGKADLITLKR